MKLLIKHSILIYFAFFSLIGFSQHVKTVEFDYIQPLLNQNNDSVYVINFWATWCKPCIEELPLFEKLRQDDRFEDINVYLISLDFMKNKQSILIPFIKNNDMKNQVIHLYEPDANKWINKVDPDWSGAIPATLIYSAEKRVFLEGKITYKQLESTINQLKER